MEAYELAVLVAVSMVAGALLALLLVPLGWLEHVRRARPAVGPKMAFNLLTETERLAPSGIEHGTVGVPTMRITGDGALRPYEDVHAIRQFRDTNDPRVPPYAPPLRSRARKLTPEELATRAQRPWFERFDHLARVAPPQRALDPTMFSGAAVVPAWRPVPGASPMPVPSADKAASGPPPSQP